jgi:serine/threonine protein phosphatase 1
MPKKKKFNRAFCIGDIHGAYKALTQVIERSGIDKEKDRLIVLGDVVDGWSEVLECVEELLSFKNLVPLIGNHDKWFMDYVETGNMPSIWTSQGGVSTIKSYLRKSSIIIRHNQEYFNQCLPYFIDKNNNAYVHGGYWSNYGLGYDGTDTYTWDRSLWEYAEYSSINNIPLPLTEMYNNVFIGHTQDCDKNGFPRKLRNVWNLDTGAGWNGKLTIMNVETEEYFQSDNVLELYPNERGRR